MKKIKAAILLCVVLLGLTACNGNQNSAQGTEEVTYRTDVSTEDLKAAVTEVLGEDYWPSYALNEEEIENLLGLTTDFYEEFTAEMPMISTNVDTLMIIKAKEGKTADVEKAVTKYREMLINDTFQYPMNIGKIQASEIAVYENYVCFVQLGADTMNAAEQGDDAVIAHCREANDKALNAIFTKLTAK
ncbi:MAG: DUF4358 domain-containing protein [Clostridiales bacterium]|nr:DUF4358 domain-containing protein [Clostridiales bacterium]